MTELAFEKVSLSPKFRSNYLKLAKYLWNIPEECCHTFDMMSFTSGVRPLNPAGMFNVGSLSNLCGTAACAVGHGPLAGIGDLQSMRYTSWLAYTQQTFCDWDSCEFNWCFGCSWKPIDNTPKGAAKRIFYMLRTGQVPDMFDLSVEERSNLLPDLYKDEEYPNEPS